MNIWKEYNGHKISVDDFGRFVVSFEENDADYFDTAQQAKDAIDKHNKMSSAKLPKLNLPVLVLTRRNGHHNASAGILTGIHRSNRNLLVSGYKPNTWDHPEFYPDHPTIKAMLERFIVLQTELESLAEKMRDLSLDGPGYGQKAESAERYQEWLDDLKTQYETAINSFSEECPQP